MLKFFMAMAFVIGLVAAGTSNAEVYTIQRSGAAVSFDYSLAGQSARGTIPVADAKIDFDIDNLASMRIDAVFAAEDASAGIAPLTAALKGPELLDTRQFAEIRFRSTSVRGTADNLEVRGEVTIRNVTRPLTLTTSVAPLGGDEGSSKYSVRMTGAIDRNEFGMTAYRNMLGDIINLNIAAQIRSDAP